MGCFICGQDNPAVLQEHHIVPQKFGGSDADENLAELCASCHQAVERMHDKRYYTELGVEKGRSGAEEKLREVVKMCLEIAQEDREEYQEKFGELPDRDEDERYGHGELAGHMWASVTTYEGVAGLLCDLFPELDQEELRAEMEAELTSEDSSKEEGEEIEVESP